MLHCGVKSNGFDGDETETNNQPGIEDKKDCQCREIKIVINQKEHYQIRLPEFKQKKNKINEWHEDWVDDTKKYFALSDYKIHANHLSEKANALLSSTENEICCQAKNSKDSKLKSYQSLDLAPYLKRIECVLFDKQKLETEIDKYPEERETESCDKSGLSIIRSEPTESGRLSTKHCGKQ